MSNSSRSWIVPAVIAGLVACTVLALALIARVRKNQIETPGGGELVFDDFGFRVVGVRMADAVGIGDRERRAKGRFWIVRLEVNNHAQRVHCDTSQHMPVLWAGWGVRYFVDREAQESLRVSGGLPPAPPRIRAGTTCVQELVYDVPASAERLDLKILWPGPVVNTLEDLLLDDNRIVLTLDRPESR